MNVTVGLLAQRPAVAAGRLVDVARVVNFSFARDRLGPLQLMESAFAVPARYLAEMARRLSRHAAPTDGLLFMNPRFDHSAFAVEAAIDTAREVGGKNELVVLTDRRGRTAALYSRRPVEE